MLDNNNKGNKFHEAAQSELVFDQYLLVFDFRMFVEIILSLKNCLELTRHGLFLRNKKKQVNSAMVDIDLMQDTMCGMMW